jgi:hypothetical protein
LAAAGPGGETSTPAANSFTCAPRRQGAAKQATTRREDQELLRLYHSERPLEQSTCASKGKLANLNYMEIKQLLDREVIENKRGTLTNGEVKLLVKEIHDHRRENK